METINKFFKNHGTKVIVILLILIYFKSCGVSGELNGVKKETKHLQIKINELEDKIYELPTKVDLEIEGLRSEKRMIQASDRRILDVQRQTEIDNEIKILKNK
jgi:hypothetical protein